MENVKEGFFKEMSWFRLIMARNAARKAARAAYFAEHGEKPVRLQAKGLKFLVSSDLNGVGWRLTMFDEHGPFGHYEGLTWLCCIEIAQTDFGADAIEPA